MLDLFITGTDSNSGKTLIAAGLAATMQSLGYPTGVFKPIECKEKNFSKIIDLDFVKSIDPYIKSFSRYLFDEKNVPLIAAESRNYAIKPEVLYQDLKICQKSQDCTIIESEGGLMTPIAPQFRNLELAKSFKVPLLFVVNPMKDSINNVLSLIEVAALSNLEVRGIILNDLTGIGVSKQYPRLIEEYSGVNILGLVKHISNILPNEIITHVLNGIDIESVFQVKIQKLDLN